MSDLIGSGMLMGVVIADYWRSHYVYYNINTIVGYTEGVADNGVG